MKPIFLVTNEELDLARKMEKKLISAHHASGILFASVRVSPKDDLRAYPVYVVTIGCAHNIDPRTMTPLVFALLKEEIDSGVINSSTQLAVTAIAGVARK